MRCASILCHPMPVSRSTARLAPHGRPRPDEVRAGIGVLDARGAGAGGCEGTVSTVALTLREAGASSSSSSARRTFLSRRPGVMAAVAPISNVPGVVVAAAAAEQRAEG